MPNRREWMPTSREESASSFLRLADIHVSQLSRENRILPTRATEERAKANIFRTHSSQRAPLGGGSCRWQNRTSICCLRPGGPSQKIEFVFAASPETIRREPREFDLLCSVGDLRDLAACALCNPVIPFLPPRQPTPPPWFSLRKQRSPFLGDPRPADTRPSSGPRPVSPDWRYPSASLVPGAGPARGYAWEPVWQLRLGRSEYACCAVWKSASAKSCPRNSSRPRTVRNN